MKQRCLYEEELCMEGKAEEIYLRATCLSFQMNINFFDQAIKAMQIYKSEIRSFPHPRFSEELKAATRRWGSVSGMQAAEPFELIRDFR